LATTLFWAHRMNEMPGRAQEALQAADRAGSPTLRNDTMVLIALKHMCYGELEESKRGLDEIISSSRSLGHKPALLAALDWRGALYFFQSEYARAEEALIEARELASDLRDGFGLLVAMFFLGLLRGNLGRMAEALTSLEEATAMARRNGDHFWFPRLPNCIGWVHRELGAFERALEYDQRGVEVARQARVSEAEANSLINVGIDYARVGDNANCLAAFQRVEDIFHGDDWFRWRYNIRHQAARSEHSLSQGNLDHATQYANALLDMASRFLARKYVAVAHKLLAQIAVAKGDSSEAEAELDNALEVLRSYPVPVVEWRVLAALGRLHSAAANPASSRDAFSRAAAIVQQIARNAPNDELRSTFLNSRDVREVLAGSA
jgi:tetratricopeptide (TPR) repeat protein